MIIFNKFNILDNLNRLGIHYEEDLNSEWVQVHCLYPYHEDFHMSAGINFSNGTYKCFKCGTTNFIKVISELLNCNYKEALNFFNNGEIKNNPNFGLENRKLTKIPKKKEKCFSNYNFTHIKLISEDYEYTRQRGFTQEFVDTFNIRECVSGFYNKYMIIPIIDKKKEINIFEARKLQEYEEALTYFQVENIDYNRMKKHIQNYLKRKNIRLKKIKKDDNYKYCLFEGDKELNIPILKYLAQKKTLYPKGSKVGDLIFNIDNLNFNEDLYIVEGIGSIPKIWSNITKNVTCTFGVEISKPQIKYLQQFKKKKIIIPDQSEAERNMIWSICCQIPNTWVAQIKSEDTDESFIEDIENVELLEGSRYLLRKSKLLEGE